MQEVLRQASFADHVNLVNACLEDASEKSAVPFIEMISMAPGKDRELWEKQLVALRVLKKIDANVVEKLTNKLMQHPSLDIRRFIQGRMDQRAQDVIYAEKGGYELGQDPGRNVYDGIASI